MCVQVPKAHVIKREQIRALSVSPLQTSVI